MFGLIELQECTFLCVWLYLYEKKHKKTPYPGMYGNSPYILYAVHEDCPRSLLVKFTDELSVVILYTLFGSITDFKQKCWAAIGYGNLTVKSVLVPVCLEDDLIDTRGILDYLNLIL